MLAFTMDVALAATAIRAIAIAEAGRAGTEGVAAGDPVIN
jgi:hypothetical protein